MDKLLQKLNFSRNSSIELEISHNDFINHFKSFVRTTKDNNPFGRIKEPYYGRVNERMFNLNENEKFWEHSKIARANIKGTITTKSELTRIDFEVQPLKSQILFLGLAVSLVIAGIINLLLTQDIFSNWNGLIIIGLSIILIDSINLVSDSEKALENFTQRMKSIERTHHNNC